VGSLKGAGEREERFWTENKEARREGGQERDEKEQELEIED